MLLSIEATGPTLGMRVAARPARNAEEFERTISAFAAEPNGGLLVLLDFVTLEHRELIIKLAAQHRLPAVYGLRVFAASGGLMSYGVNSIDLFRRGASYVDRILKGAKPADLPVQQAADQVRAGHQSQDREGAGPRHITNADRACRRSDRMKAISTPASFGGNAFLP
jgi:ABC-type uncharacterized transport system substrate-binding protein